MKISIQDTIREGQLPLLLLKDIWDGNFYTKNFPGDSKSTSAAEADACRGETDGAS